MLGKIESGRRRGQLRTRWLDGVTDFASEPALGDGDGQGGPGCCSLQSHRADTTERLNTEGGPLSSEMQGLCHVRTRPTVTSQLAKCDS